MIKKFLYQSTNFMLLSVALPFISGCTGGGAGGTASLGSLFSASDGSSIVSGPGGGSELATIHNPEPTTMLLVGGGMMAMAYFRNQRVIKP